MKLFPRHWANQTIEFEVVSAPIGRECPYCNKPIGAADDGLLMPYWGTDEEMEKGITDIAYHRDCFLLSLGIKDMCI